VFCGRRGIREDESMQNTKSANLRRGAWYSAAFLLAWVVASLARARSLLGGPIAASALAVGCALLIVWSKKRVDRGSPSLPAWLMIGIGVLGTAAMIYYCRLSDWEGWPVFGLLSLPPFFLFIAGLRRLRA
jgi:hypothetical protein